MAYVPQFIPTNTQVLQGTLDQYQKASDTETARQNQVNDMYSAIPTTRAYDTAKKNEEMGKFTNILGELDKKYNYDRSNQQYAKDLASEITKLRSNPLWAHIQQKDEVDKIRQQLVAQRGADYYENFNPNDVTLENAKDIQNWKPADIKDVKTNAALRAKEFATAWRGRKSDRTSIPGTIQYLDQWGAKDEQEAETYLNAHPEELLASIPQGFDPNDPRVLSAAKNAWISNAIGEIKPSDSPDNAYLADERNAHRTGVAGKGPAMTLLPISNTPNVNPEQYAYQSVKEKKSSQTTLNDLDKQINQEADPDNKKALIAQKNGIETELNIANDVIERTEKSSIGQKVLKVGDGIITSKLPDISSDTTLVSSINQKLRDYFRGTTDLQRVDETSGKIGQLVAGAEILGKDMITPTVELGNKIGKLYSSLVSVIVPWSGNSMWIKNQRESAIKSVQPAVMALAKSMKGKPMEEFNGKINVSNDITADILRKSVASGKYGDVHNMKEDSPEAKTALKAINKDFRKEFPSVLKMVTEYESFYKGKDNYVDRGLPVIDKQIDKTLKQGKDNQYVESTPVIGDITDVPKYNNLVSFITSIFDRMKPIEKDLRQRDGQLWNPDALASFKKDIKDNGADIRILTNGDDPVRIALVSKGTNKRATVELDESQSSNALIEELYSMTVNPATGMGDLTILNQIYRDVNLSPNKIYTFKDFQPILSRHFQNGDLTGLENFAIEKTREDNALRYNLYIDFDPSIPKNKQKEPIKFNNRTDLMMTLNQYKKAQSNSVTQK